MTRYSKEELLRIFQSPFNQDAWKSIVINLFHADKVRSVKEKFTDEEDKEEGFYLGSAETLDSYRIGLFYYRIKQGSVAHKKVGLRNLVKGFINQNWGKFDAAIVVFDSGEEWRLSFVCDIKEHATAPKRFTFVFGEKDSQYRTPIERFDALQGQESTFENIRKAFSVEALSDDFFNEYRDLYADFVQYITGKRYVKESGKWVEKPLGKPDHQYFDTFEENDKLVRDYIKKMFGRIVFLYFLQRKGWLANNRNYMRDLYEDSNYKDNFLDGVLEPLFFDVLNEKPENRQPSTRELPGVERIPYLNGGLFAKDDIDDRTCIFPKEYFGRLFGFLDSYNFTIDENDTDDAEIGIDPEMLGRIFENLLEDNKDKGAFYTPKEIVGYMCRESIIAYLQDKDFSKEGNDLIRQFVETFDNTLLSKEQRAYIKDKLKVVKICDPAIGSGAFPMGLVNLLAKLYSSLRIKDDASVIKRHIMEQNIYGVDIEKGAVDIARLRFWLAMIVEEKEPVPLPNLHFKIMQGNSLLESYNGIDLSDLTKVKEYGNIFELDSTDNEDLVKMLKAYYKTSDHAERDRLFSEIIKNVRRQLYAKEVTLPTGMDPSENSEFFLWHTWFSDVFEKGGFDIVIGNPPYLEARSTSFKTELKDSLQQELKMKCPDDYNSFPKGSDLLVFFYELSLRLLSKEGINSFITENAWLATDYGRLFQDYLLKKSNIKAIVDSEYKYFENADINTVITFFKLKESTDFKNEIKFFHSMQNLKEYPCRIDSNSSMSGITLKRFDYDNLIIRQYKWSVILKAEKRILNIIDILTKKVDDKLRRKISIGQGLNLTKSKIIKIKEKDLVPYYTSDDGPLYLWDTPLNYIKNINLSKTRKQPILVMPRGIGTHFCAINNCHGYTYSYVEIYGNLSRSEILNIWLFCNSSIFWLLRELTGRTNLGGGMLKAEATDLKSLPITFNFNREKEIEDIYNTALNKKNVQKLELTLESPLHHKIDDIVFEFFQITNDRDFIIQEL